MVISFYEKKMRKIYLLLLLLIVTACAKTSIPSEVWIKNAQGEDIYVKIDGQENANAQKLAFIQHGLSANMNHRIVQTAKKAFLDNGYTVITFDSRHSLGKSGNDVKKARLATFADDLETVINWAKEQSFYHEPFALSGHSLGGASVLEYSAKYPQRVAKLVPIAPVVSGDNWEKACFENMSDFCQNWQQNGIYEYTDEKTGITAQIAYEVITDSKNYDAYELAPKIKADTLVISAQNDIIVPASGISGLAELGLNNIHTVQVANSGHNFESEQNSDELYRVINEFID